MLVQVLASRHEADVAEEKAKTATRELEKMQGRYKELQTALAKARAESTRGAHVWGVHSEQRLSGKIVLKHSANTLAHSVTLKSKLGTHTRSKTVRPALVQALPLHKAPR